MMDKQKRLLKLGTGIMVLALLAGVMLAGCSTPEQEQENGIAPDYDETKTNGIEVNYTVIEDEYTLPQAIHEDLNLIRDQKGYFVFSPPDYDTGEDIYLVVNAGEKQTGGYKIMLETIKNHDDTLMISVEVEEPSPEDMVIQVLTYPRLIIKLDRAYNEYNITGTANESYTKISPDSIPEKQEARGIYTGQVDNNFIEISVDGIAGTYLLPQDLSWVLAELLNSGDEVVFTFYKNEHEQLVIRDLNTTERAAMIRNVKGTYTGRIDSNSVEIEVEGKPEAYVPAEQILIGNFNEGDKVVFDYYEDRYGRRIISRMEKE